MAKKTQKKAGTKKTTIKKTAAKKKQNINIQVYSNFIKQCFINRRKKLKNNLKDVTGDKNLDFLGNKRPEDLSILEYIDIFNKYSF